MFKFALLVEYNYKHCKYAVFTPVFFFFAKVLAVLSKEEAKGLLANRFFNSEGRKGENKPLDLQMEHLNVSLKMVLKSLFGKRHKKISTEGRTFP